MPHTLDIIIKSATLTVEFDYYPPSKGVRDSLGGVPNAGPPLEEDEPEEVEILTVSVGGEEITDLLSDDVFPQLRREILKKRRDG